MDERKNSVEERPAIADPSAGGNGGPATIKSAVTDAPAPSRERRKHPRISETPPAPPPAPRLDDYEPIIGKPQLDELRFLARPLRGSPRKW